jgi:hypothetical protein
MATKKKRIATEAAEAPEELAFESGTTEAEYQEPVVPVDPVDDYLQKTYPGLGQNIPNILHAILREIVIGRLK